MKMNICNWIDENQRLFTQTCDAIWGLAELKFEEKHSAQLLIDLLQEHGFTIQSGVADMETAFVASYGEGKPEIGILGEFDALSGMSQKADIFLPEKQDGMENGHGCGHQIFGAASAAAAIAVRYYLESQNLPGTIRFFGCPGEEGGSGKAFMARAGLFDDLDCAVAWHPASINGVQNVSTLANIQAYFRFTGKSAHAAASPHLGRSALDSVEIMNIGSNYLREHIIPEARLHYAVTNTGGSSPNVVQAHAEVLYLIRAPHPDQLTEIYARVCDIARGAALITGTQCEIVFDKACSNVVPNDTLGKVMDKKMRQIGAPDFTDAEKAYAIKYIQTFSQAEKGSMEDLLRALGPNPELAEFMQRSRNKPLQDELVPYFFLNKAMPGSSDVGDVSWITPTVQCNTTCYAAATPAHSWQMVAQGKSSIAHKGLLYAAKTMALTAVEVFQDPSIAQQAQKELHKILGGKTYVCPIPDGVQPKPYR